MKKTLALLACIVMAAAAMTACGDSDSSSSSKRSTSTGTAAASETTASAGTTEAPETTAAPETTEAPADTEAPKETKGTEPEESEPDAGEAGPLFKALNEKIKSSNAFVIKGKMGGGSMIQGEIEIRYNNGNSYARMNMNGMDQEFYNVDGKAITVMSATKTYLEGEGLGVNVDLLNEEKIGTFAGTAEEDGMTVESYTDSEDGDTKLYFSGSDLKKISNAKGSLDSIEMEFECDPITMPDLSGYEPMQNEMGAFFQMALQSLGITNEMLEAEGLTMEDLIAKGDDMLPTLKQICEKNGIDTSMLDALLGS